MVYGYTCMCVCVLISAPVFQDAPRLMSAWPFLMGVRHTDSSEAALSS